MATHFTKLFGRKLKCLDIASNDGCLLNEFKRQGCSVIGVEPAENVCKTANERGIRTICEFWGKVAAGKVLDETGKVDIATATNVFAHVDDVHGFVDNVYDILDDDGVFVTEFPYMGNLVKFCEFDTIYHEHLSYFLIKPIVELMKQHRMRIYDISMQDIHGGTIRITSMKDTNKLFSVSDNVERFLKVEEEDGLHDIAIYRKLEESAAKIKKDFCETLINLKKQGKKIAGYGAPAKGNVFVNYCRLDSDSISFIVDDTKAKQGLIYPGTKIPIVDNSWIEKEKPDYLVILPWNFAKEIMNKTQEFRQKDGKYIIAIPELKVI
jgi:SAM-dependent methyltransferase